MRKQALVTLFTLPVLAFLAVTLAACGDTTQPSGVDGIVLFAGGPYAPSPSPSSLPGGFGPATQGMPYRFVRLQVTATSGANAGKVVAEVKPDAQALFEVSLPPGSYVLKPLVPKNGPFPMPTEVTVRAGEHARAIVYVSGP
jgi:hypothetical protein